MLLLVFSVICHLKVQGHTCDHDEYQDKTLRELPPQKLVKTSHTISNPDDREPIRLYFINSSIGDASKDPSYQCTSAGQMVGSVACQESDIVTPEKASVIKVTMENVKRYVESFIKVDPITGPFGISVGGDYSSLDKPAQVVDTDLAILVVARPYGNTSSTLASASVLGRESTNRRPTIGVIKINPSVLPSEPQDYNSGNRQFFTTLVHELMHVLAFSQGTFDDWYDPLTGLSHDKIIVNYKNKHDMDQTFLSTPRLRDWVHKRFNVHSSNLLDFGLEIEDGGGAGTAGSHPNERLFFTDLMQGKTYGIAYIGPIFFMSLEDSGFYTINSSVRAEIEEDFVYLDISKTSRTERINENILIESGWHTFPKSYMCDKPDTSMCFYDYATKGVCFLKKSTKGSSEIPSSWYNPKNQTYIGSDDVLDHLPLIIPATASYCRNPDAPAELKKQAGFETYDPGVYAETYGNQSVCAMSTLFNDRMGGVLPSEVASCFYAWCGTDYRVRLVINGKEMFCKEPGMRFTVPGYGGYVVCPPGKAACSNLPKKKLINMIDVIPDRGPIDGTNLIRIHGYGFDEFDKNDLSIRLGPVNITIIDKTDTNILAQVQSIPESIRSSLIMKAVVLHGEVAGNPEITTDLEGMYTFTSKTFEGV